MTAHQTSRLDPLAKFLIVLCVSSLAIAFANFYLLLGILVGCIVAALFSQVSLRLLWGYTRVFAYLIVLLVVVQAVFYPFQITVPLLKIPADAPLLANVTVLSLDGIVYGLTLGMRLIALVLASTLFSLTTAPRDFLVAMRRIKVPFELIFMVNVALRFIPDIKDKASEVMLAQTARGLELEKGNIITRAKNFLPLLTPLLVNYLLMARNSAVAIETRAFRWKNQRTYMRSMQLTPVDYLVIVLAVGLTVLCAAVFWRYGAELKIL